MILCTGNLSSRMIRIIRFFSKKVGEEGSRIPGVKDSSVLIMNIGWFSYSSHYRMASIPISRECGKQILAGQVVRLIVCVGRETLREFEGERVAKVKTSSFDIPCSIFTRLSVWRVLRFTFVCPWPLGYLNSGTLVYLSSSYLLFNLRI
jgi:hypothetical protein